MGLERFVPEGELVAPVEIRENLAPIIERISRVIPKELIWQFFSSPPESTGGKIRFPTFAAGMDLITCRDVLRRLRQLNLTPEGYNQKYQAAVETAFKSVVCIEIGFGGLANFHKSKAFTNWSEDLTHKERTYKEIIGDFKRFRQDRENQEDLFSQYALEYLLERF